jgi:hypothetical protein
MAARIVTTVHAVGAATTAASDDPASNGLLLSEHPSPNAVSGLCLRPGERTAGRLLKIDVRNRKEEELIKWPRRTSTLLPSLGT